MVVRNSVPACIPAASSDDIVISETAFAGQCQDLQTLRHIQEAFADYRVGKITVTGRLVKRKNPGSNPLD